MGKILRVTKKNKCKICGRGDWCGISPDGNLAFCTRVESDKPARNGAFIHVLDDSVKPKLKAVPAPIAKPKQTLVKRSSGELNEIYSEFLDHLVLSESHKNELRRRGLTLVDIHLHGYKSMPSQMLASRISQNIKRAGFDLGGVPGFYRFTDWHFRTYNLGGFIIPIRNFEHKIIGLQLRADDGQKWSDSFAPKYLMVSSDGKPQGTSSGTPAHFATLGNLTPNSRVKSVIVTEGALKANIIQTFTGEATIGLVGVGCFDETFPEALKIAFPALEKCSIAFDMDSATNAAVRNQLNRLILTLEKSTLETSVLSWNRQFKGFDDYLLAQTKSQRQAA